MNKNMPNNEAGREADHARQSFETPVEQSGIDPQLMALLDQVCESGEDALGALQDYLDAHPMEESAAKPDTEAALRKFEEEHSAVFGARRKSRVVRWGYRLCVAAAAIVVLNTLCIFAFGRSMYDYVAMWGAETFGYIMQLANPEKYDPDTYHNPNEEWVGELPDTDVTALGLAKSESEWNHSHKIETFRILDEDVIEVAAALGIHVPMLPTWIPDGYVLDEILVTKNHVSNSMDLDISYEKSGEEYLFGVSLIAVEEGIENGRIEKDDRPVITFSAGGVDWYIMHNLDNINATTIVNDYLVLLSGPVTVDEMKHVIDSVYERN